MKRNSLLTFFIAVACVLFAPSCNDHDQDYYDSLTSDAVLLKASYEWNETHAVVSTEGARQTTFEISVAADWCSLSPYFAYSSLKGTANSRVTVYMKPNRSGLDRETEITVRFSDGETVYLTLTQLCDPNDRADNPDDDPAGDDPKEPDKNDPDRNGDVSYKNHKWAELPAHKQNDDYIYKTYFTTLTTGQPQNGYAMCRNYTVCFDTKRHVSQWVAYPLHECYLSPSVSRTDPFGYDPNNQLPYISQELQQDIAGSSYGVTYNDQPANNDRNKQYERGHMLPHASRLDNYGTNEQVFYATNMMPQHGNFNGGVWATLEDGVRANVASDTLYVVTGTYFGDDFTITYKGGSQVAVPTHAYKVLLRTKKGNTGKSIGDITSADELIAIGFWMANPKLGQPSTATISGSVKSVKEIEELTGFSFFEMLNPSIADAVKQQKNRSDWKSL